jgi:hypothetical protein
MYNINVQHNYAQGMCMLMLHMKIIRRKTMDDAINRSQISFSKDELKKMSPEDRKRFARSIILKVVKDNPQGISVPQISDVAGIDRRTASKHLEYLTAIRELYQRQFSQRNILYYPNGKVAHPTLIKDIKIGEKYYNFQLIENPFGKFVYIQEKTRDEYNLFTIVGGLMLNANQLDELILHLKNIKKEVDSV